MKKLYQVLLMISAGIFVGIGIIVFVQNQRPESGVLFEADFDVGNDISSMEFVYSGNKNARIIGIAGRRAAEISLSRYEDKVTYRSEIVPENLPSSYFKNGKFALFGKEYWYGARIWLPKKWGFPNENLKIMQWHGQPDVSLKETWRNPPLLFEIANGPAGEGKNYFIRMRGDSKRVTGRHGPYEFSERVDIGAVGPDLGTWVYWVFHVKWSSNDDGLLVVYKDGKEVLRRTNQKTAYNDEFGPYWKLGVYIPGWKDVFDTPEQGVGHYTLYFDDVRIGSNEVDWRY